MIFDSLGFGELLVIFVLIVFLVEPKRIGKVMRELGKAKRWFSKIQANVRTQLDSITAAVDDADAQDKLNTDKVSMRRWARARVAALPAVERAKASEALAASVGSWPGFAGAKVVACFSGALDEVDTGPLIRRILTEGKTLLLPYVHAGISRDADAVGGKTLGMAAITDPEKDLEEGVFGIQEPKAHLRIAVTPAPDLVLVPGLCFDARGGRLGKGFGYYDRYLAESKAFKLGICFDAQIAPKNLALEPHDQFLDAVVSEKRFLLFSAPRPAENLSPPEGAASA